MKKFLIEKLIVFLDVIFCVTGLRIQHYLSLVLMMIATWTHNHVLIPFLFIHVISGIQLANRMVFDRRQRDIEFLEGKIEFEDL